MPTQVKKGTSRLVIISSLFPGLVIKIPIIRLKDGIGTLISERKRWLEKETWDERPYWGIGWCLYKGILDNWREYRFYRNSRHAFLQATYFSLLGIINVQKRGRVIQCDIDKFWCCIYDATDGEVTNDAHHFKEAGNFCLDGWVRLLDYGDHRTHVIVEKYGTKIMEVIASNLPELSRAT